MFAIRCLVCNRAVNLIGAFRFHSFSFRPRRSRGVGDAQRSWRFVPITISCSEADGNCHGKWGAAFFRGKICHDLPTFFGKHFIEWVSNVLDGSMMVHVTFKFGYRLIDLVSFCSFESKCHDGDRLSMSLMFFELGLQWEVPQSFFRTLKPWKFWSRQPVKFLKDASQHVCQGVNFFRLFSVWGLYG